MCAGDRILISYLAVERKSQQAKQTLSRQISHFSQNCHQVSSFCRNDSFKPILITISLIVRTANLILARSLMYIVSHVWLHTSLTITFYEDLLRKLVKEHALHVYPRLKCFSDILCTYRYRSTGALSTLAFVDCFLK